MRRIALISLAMFFASCGSNQNSSQLSFATEETNLKEISEKEAVVSLIQMGSPLNPNPCQGFSFSYSRLSGVAQVNGCKDGRYVNKDVKLTASQKSQMGLVLKKWKVSPVPPAAYSTPCVAHDGGGYRANALTSTGLKEYSLIACEHMIPDGVLQYPGNSAVDETDRFVNSLL